MLCCIYKCKQDNFFVVFKYEVQLNYEYKFIFWSRCNVCYLFSYSFIIQMLYAIIKHFWKVSMSFCDSSNKVSMLLTYFFKECYKISLINFSLPFFVICMIIDIFHHFLGQWNTDSQRSKDTYKIIRSI